MSAPFLVDFFDTKSYDREFFAEESLRAGIKLVWHEFALNRDTASVGKGTAVCVFVHDDLSASCLEVLAARGVKLAALRCAGFNFVDLEVARRLGIRVVRVPAYSPHAVAEHTVGLLLSLNRKLHRAHNRMREHNFSLEGLVGFDLAGKTAGVVGCGKIGRVVAQILRGFGMQVLAYDPCVDSQWAEEHGVVFQDLSDVFRQSDVITLHAPLTPGTKYLINAGSIAMMRQGAVIVNTGRGKLVDTSAVMKALKSGHLAGFAADVYEEEENLFFHDKSAEILDDETFAYLLTFPNVLITAHQAFLTREALREIARTTMTNIQAFRDGNPLLENTVLV